MQKQSFTVEQVPDSDVMLEILDTQGTFLTRGGNKPKDRVQGSEDDVFESLQSQEMFITQREPFKHKDRISDSDDLFQSDDEIFTIQGDHPRSKDQVSYSTSHPGEDGTPRNRKNRRLLNKQVKKKLFLGKMKDLQEKVRVGSSQFPLPQGTRTDAQLEKIDQLFVPSQSQRLDTQMFNISDVDQEAVVNDLQDLISPSVTEDEKKKDCYKNTNSREMTATTCSQTDLTVEHMQSQKLFDSCMDCEYLLLTAETLMLLVRIMYDNSRFRNRTLDKSSPGGLQGSEKKMTNSSSQMRSTPIKNMKNAFLTEIRLLKEDLDNKLGNTDKDMEDSGYLEEEDEEDASRDCHLEVDLNSHQKSRTTENLGRKKTKFEDIETKQVKKKKRDETENLARSQKKKEKGQRKIKKEPLEDIPVESLPCPHELKRQLKKKIGENSALSGIKKKSKRPTQSREQSKAALCDVLSSQFAKDLEVGLSKKKKKPKKGETNAGRIKIDQQKVWKSCCNPGNVKVKNERREERKQKMQKILNKKRR